MAQRSPVGVAHRVGWIDGGQVRRLSQCIAVLGKVPLQGPQVLVPYRRREAGKLLLQRRQPVDELGVKSVNPRLVHLPRGSLLQQIDDLVLDGDRVAGAVTAIGLRFDDGSASGSDLLTIGADSSDPVKLAWTLDSSIDPTTCSASAISLTSSKWQQTEGSLSLPSAAAARRDRAARSRAARARASRTRRASNQPARPAAPPGPRRRCSGSRGRSTAR